MEAALKQIRSGAQWTILFSILNKVVTFFAQIAIAWFIVPEEMGLVAICTSIATIGQIFTASGLKL